MSTEDLILIRTFINLLPWKVSMLVRERERGDDGVGLMDLEYIYGVDEKRPSPVIKGWNGTTLVRLIWDHGYRPFLNVSIIPPIKYYSVLRLLFGMSTIGENFVYRTDTIGTSEQFIYVLDGLDLLE